ncbi:hypothetical protein BDV95DRAFT_646770 [Massariosphaeria phaeospora]|uniref:Uncharacterized protein n=1 Tax=Massariosphaeria phaeospora TaxID=100035 RepID=A0A7C8M3I9_9PLEO|nr:hypothetical protein BDV95DRAFT_646770 [Massariosphaeria phaeospora]
MPGQRSPAPAPALQALLQQHHRAAVIGPRSKQDGQAAGCAGPVWAISSPPYCAVALLVSTCSLRHCYDAVGALHRERPAPNVTIVPRVWCWPWAAAAHDRSRMSRFQASYSTSTQPLQSVSLLPVNSYAQVSNEAGKNRDSPRGRGTSVAHTTPNHRTMFRANNTTYGTLSLPASFVTCGGIVVSWNCLFAGLIELDDVCQDSAPVRPRSAQVVSRGRGVFSHTTPWPKRSIPACIGRPLAAGLACRPRALADALSCIALRGTSSADNTPRLVLKRPTCFDAPQSIVYLGLLSSIRAASGSSKHSAISYRCSSDATPKMGDCSAAHYAAKSPGMCPTSIMWGCSISPTPDKCPTQKGVSKSNVRVQGALCW